MFDSLEQAETHGIALGLFQAAVIARRALMATSTPLSGDGDKK